MWGAAFALSVLFAKGGEVETSCGGEGQRPCSLRSGKGKAVATPVLTTCASLEDTRNLECKDTVLWAASGGGKSDPHALHWFQEMQTIAGVDIQSATEDDFQRLYFCAPPGGKWCGSPPCTCSKPPCNRCLATEAPRISSAVCTSDGQESVGCKPPERALQYNGMHWPTMTIATGTEQEIHLFAIGDWGGLDGSLNPIEGRAATIAYPQGVRSGPHVFPRTRWNLYHDKLLCSHSQFLQCYSNMGDPPCEPGCGFVKGVDDQPQILVAEAMKARAANNTPVLVLNAGDNFYWGGIEKNCGTPMDVLSYTAHHQFDQVFESIYTGPGLESVPWLSVLGNHDWGGRVFNNGWDQQIAYTWKSRRWIMPAAYYTARAEFPDQDFSVDFFMVDTNVLDAKEPYVDPEHNICGMAYNKADANCSSQGGPESVETCTAWFRDLWNEQVPWLEQSLSRSTADWQIMLTHFPCNEAPIPNYYAKLHLEFGLDLLVTGHRHDQELDDPGKYGGLTCFVTGGGGGISSEATPNEEEKTDWYGEGQYGFYDLTISKEKILVESINYDGRLLKNATVYPRAAS